MKSIFILCLFLIFCAFHSIAQTTKIDSLLQHRANPEETPLPTSEMGKHIHKDVCIYEVISGYKILNDTLKILYIGGKFRKHKAIIFVKGKKANDKFKFKSGEKWHFSGIVFSYEGKPAITITDPSVFYSTRIMI